MCVYVSLISLIQLLLTYLCMSMFIYLSICSCISLFTKEGKQKEGRHTRLKFGVCVCTYIYRICMSVCMYVCMYVNRVEGFYHA